MERTGQERRENLLAADANTFGQAFNIGTSDAIQNVIDELDLQAAKRVKEGFNEVAFTLGVLNCFLILFIFDDFPQHFWLLFLVEAFFFVPRKFYQMIHAVPNQALYYLDFCWIMNFIGVIVLLILMFGKNVLPEQLIKVIFSAAYGVSCGPLLGANLALPFVALIFHDVSSMTSLFIHIYPPLLLYIMRWKAEEVVDAWPNTFQLDYDVNFFPSADDYYGSSFVQSIFGATTILYFMWFIPYTIWQLLFGLNLPKNNGKFDTVFHANMRNGLCIQIGNIFWKRPLERSREQMKTNSFEMRDFAVYSTFHVILAFASLLVFAYPCSLSRHVHGSFLIFCLIICTWRGAQRYTYYSTEMYSNLIRKQFTSELNPNKTTRGVI